MEVAYFFNNTFEYLFNFILINAILIKIKVKASQSPTNKMKSKKHQQPEESAVPEFMNDEDLINNVLTHISFVTVWCFEFSKKKIHKLKRERNKLIFFFFFIETTFFLTLY